MGRGGRWDDGEGGDKRARPIPILKQNYMHFSNNISVAS
jgi:hypothetical protein